MPCYNEEATVADVIGKVLESPLVAEVVAVDDGSTDATRSILHEIADERVRVFEQPINLGKGAALRRGFREATAEYVIVQDADLEYDPADFAQVLEPLIAGRADVVYGSRFLGGQAHRVLYYWHSVGNKLLTTASNMFTNLNLTDMETCYKAFRRDVIQSLVVEEDRFGFEPEITAKIARKNLRVYEVGISYDGRTYAEGKKIGWRDGVRAVYSIVRYSRIADRIDARAVNRHLGPAHFDQSDAELAETLDSLGDAPNYTNWIYSMCEPYLGREVLEVGAGHGDLTRLLMQDRMVTATDLSKRCVELLAHEYERVANVDVRQMDIAEIPERDHFDSALLINVLEHIEDDLGALRDLRERLSPGGHVIVFAPAFEGLYSEFDRRIGHHRRYRRAGLVELADAADLEVVDARYVSSIGAVIWWAYARHLRRVPTKPGNVRLYDRLIVPLLRRMESRRPPKFGQSVLLVARRPAAAA
jgi:2-polyprenyl-3-methyl-5-hydroxy-6-metoxy-1,4-benzoquinol methylase